MYLLRYSEQRVLRSKELGNLYTLVHSGRVYEVHEHIKALTSPVAMEQHLISFYPVPLCFLITLTSLLLTYFRKTRHWLKPLFSVHKNAYTLVWLVSGIVPRKRSMGDRR